MKQSLIFLHGGPGYPDYLERFFQGRFPSTIRTTFFSQQQRDSTTVGDLVAEVGEKVSREGEPVFLVGHSWGGVLAVEYLRRTCDRGIKGLVLIGSYLCTEDVTKEYEKELERLNLHKPTMEQVFLTPDEAREVGDLIPELDKTFNRAVFKRLWSDFLSTFDLREYVKSADIPILNIFGERDIRVPARRVRTYSDLSASVRNLEIPGAGHFPFILEPHRAQVVAAIAQFARDGTARV